ncbi:potassium sodium efflux p-type atpase, fungal-type [Trichoderma arundinaceum]|uniref:Potassium sodium efflux p-type atpase, fungal-type n=1 Tax=Trichoderma arundinaceum TaxID=490622 RepID=A0A395NEU6_TRIAR|nr:potassium sodium efflux p-type atpase, fungal-type [Trichoderma arundinaceum]
MRLQNYGKNNLGETEGTQLIGITIARIANAMTIVLILAMAVSYGIKSYIEGGVITFVILLNVVAGFLQEYSAGKRIDSLRSLSSPTATVVKDFKAGDTIPADIRLIEVVNFETDETFLTGGSLPVRKNEDAIFDDATGPGDHLNVAYSSSTVTKGRAKGVVFTTGASTEIGASASVIQNHDSKIRPVQHKADGSAKPRRYLEAYTLTLADAIRRFIGVNRNVIVRNLKSLEALGAVTDICSDGTGTLTQGKMVARGAWIPSKGTYTIGNSPSPFDAAAGDIRYDPRQPREINLNQGGDACGIVASAEEFLSQSSTALTDFLRVAFLANLATVVQKDGLVSHDGHNQYSEVVELPFDSDVKRMSVIMKDNSSGKLIAFTKGAVERVLEACTAYRTNDSDDVVPLSE